MVSSQATVVGPNGSTMAPVGGASRVAAGTLSGVGASLSTVPVSTGPVVVLVPQKLPATSAAVVPVLVRPPSRLEPAALKARTSGLLGSGPVSASVKTTAPVISLPAIEPRCPYV